jgi:signal transduction histidine kinase
MIQTGRTPNLSQLAGVREILKDCTANLRNLLLDLEPEEMRDQDLEESLRRFERYLQSISRQSADFRLEDGVLDGLDRDVQLQVYYIVRELLSNATRHAQPERTKLHIGRNSQYLTIHWENDGFTPVDEIKPGNGLHNIGHRVHQLDGTFNYGLHRRRTWRVTIELPFTALNGSLSLGEGGVNR